MNPNENSAHSFTEGSDSGTPVSTVKEETKTFTIEDQVDAVSVARLGHAFDSDFRLALDAAHETLQSISLDKQQVSDLLKENQELKADLLNILKLLIEPESGEVYVEFYRALKSSERKKIEVIAKKHKAK